jgi:hypothetical protein
MLTYSNPKDSYIRINTNCLYNRNDNNIALQCSDAFLSILLCCHVG